MVLMVGPAPRDRTAQKLPQSDLEWLASGDFTTTWFQAGRYQIHCANTELRVRESHSLKNCHNIFVGGIPRDPDRQKKLPLINKLFGLLARTMLAHNQTSLLYSQPGTGRSEGNLKDIDLRVLRETLCAISHAAVQHVRPLQLIGSSSAAYTVVRSLSYFRSMGINVRSVVLLSPAAFAPLVEYIPYGQQFREAVRRPWSPTTSPCFSDLHEFLQDGGRVYLSYFERDDPPIPRTIQDAYLQLIENARVNGLEASATIFTGVEHNFRYLNSDHSQNLVCNDSVRAASASIAAFLS